MLLDDELPGLTYLKMLCEQVPGLEVVRSFDNPVSFLSEAGALEFDLCILDIEMPGMNGLQVANLLNGKPVIFATAYKEHAADAFDLNAVDYIRKPIKLERLRQAVEKAMKRLHGTEGPDRRPFIQLNTDRGKALIHFDRIACITTSTVDARDKVLRFTDGQETVLKNINFKTLAELLPSSEFCRVNRRELISIRSVQVFSADEIVTDIDGTQGRKLRFTLSEAFRNEFLSKVSL